MSNIADLKCDLITTVPLSFLREAMAYAYVSEINEAPLNQMVPTALSALLGGRPGPISSRGDTGGVPGEA